MVHKKKPAGYLSALNILEMVIKILPLSLSKYLLLHFISISGTRWPLLTADQLDSIQIYLEWPTIRF